MKKFLFFILLLSVYENVFSKTANKNICFGISNNIFFNFGTTCEDDFLNKAAEQYSDFGYDEKNNTSSYLGINAFARFEFPFAKNFGLQTDFSYYQGNGFKKEFSKDNSVMNFKYEYQSIDLAPLLTYDLAKSNWGLCFFAGPTFSFPIGKIQYKYTFSEDSSQEFRILTVVSYGATCGLYAGYRLSHWEVFMNLRYICDFTPVSYKINDTEQDLLIRRAFGVGIGVNYAIK